MVKREYFNEMYCHLWHTREELDAVILPKKPEFDAWERIVEESGKCVRRKAGIEDDRN